MRPSHSCGLVFKECFESGYFSHLSRLRFALELLERLPAQPAELVVVPHVHKGPARTRILDILVLQVRSVSGAISLDCGWKVEVPNLFAIRITNEVSQPAVIHPLRAIFRIPNEFVDEIAEMQHEAEAVLFPCSFIFKDHSSVRVLCSLRHILTTHESKANRPWVIRVRRCNRATNATANAFSIRKARRVMFVIPLLRMVDEVIIDWFFIAAMQVAAVINR